MKPNLQRYKLEFLECNVPIPPDANLPVFPLIDFAEDWPRPGEVWQPLKLTADEIGVDRLRPVIVDKVTELPGGKAWGIDVRWVSTENGEPLIRTNDIGLDVEVQGRMRLSRIST